MKLLNQKFPGMCILIKAIFFFLLFPQTGEGHTIHVPGQFNSIQEAINVSVNGDTVLVDDGFYQEQVNFLGKNIVVTSRFILDHDSIHIYNTEINRSYLNEGVKFINGEGPSAQLIGFTISNCLWDAVYCKNSSPRIRNNIIKGNKGFGICLENSTAIISDNEIHCYPGFDMSGPYDAVESFNSGPIIERNLIDGNDLAGNVYAINFDLWNYILPGITNDIRENLIIGGIFGGLPDNGLPQRIHHNTFISGNGYTSAMNITECASNLKIYNNTVTGGGGIWIQGGNFPDIRNNVVAYANNGIELWVDTATIAFNNVWDCNNLYSGIPDQTGKNGNISVDPGFRDLTNGDFHFFCWSKCIDAGDILSDYSQEPTPNGGRINMGRYGNTPEAELSGPCIRTFPENIDFGYIPVNNHKDSALLIVNAGHGQLNISGVNNSNINIFGTNYPGGSTLLNPDDSLVLIVTFHPLTNKIYYSDSILIASNSVTPGKIYLKGHTAMDINNNQIPEGIELYPVPVTGDYLYIKTGISWSQNSLVEIFQISGEAVCSEFIHPTGDHLLKINTDKLRAGIYYLRIKNGSYYLTGKFIVIRN